MKYMYSLYGGSYLHLYFVIITLLITSSGCKEVYNFPDEQLYLDDNIVYESQYFEPVIGRLNRMGTVNLNYSTMPITFEIINARYGSGKPYVDLFQIEPTYVWDKKYTGEEISLEEIENKRHLEDHALFEVDGNGQFILWPSSTDELVEPRSEDGTDLTQNIRFFDLKISNPQGQTIIKDFQILPYRERPYDPYTDIDPLTGLAPRDPSFPHDPTKQDHIVPTLNNVYSETTGKIMENEADDRDIIVFIRRFEGGNGHSLRFKFIDKDELPINPVQFNETDWDYLVHGFNRIMTDEYVQYDVAYPIPLSTLTTRYVNDGSAHTVFSYSRLGFGGTRVIGEISLDFKIHREGDWEIVFQFKNDKPKFEDE